MWLKPLSWRSKDDATIAGNGDGNGQVPPGQTEDEDGTIVNPGGNVAPGLNRGDKIDKPDARPDAVHTKVFDLFCELNASDEQLDFPLLYASGRDGWAVRNLDDPREYCKALGIMIVPFICIMTQPDLGTGLVYLFIAAFALVVGGARAKYLVITLGLFIAAIAAVFALDEVLKYRTSDGSWEYRLLKQYQRNRLLVFLNQGGTDMSDEGYNLQQAMIAIGSGGLFGKGLFQSSQGTLGYLPEAPTDFIFCVLAEELGFVGALFLLALYAALIIACIRIARSCGDLFGMVIVMCVVGMWMFQILENIGMDIGLMPITGIPLPFVSYGSSFMVVNFALLGIIGSVWSHGAASGKKDGYATTH